MKLSTSLKILQQEGPGNSGGKGIERNTSASYLWR